MVTTDLIPRLRRSLHSLTNTPTLTNMNTPIIDLNTYCDRCGAVHNEFGNLCADCEAKETAEQEDKIASTPVTSTVLTF